MILLKNLLGLGIAAIAFVIFITIFREAGLSLGLAQLLGPGLAGLIWGVLLIAYMLLVAKYVRKLLWKGPSLADLTELFDKPEDSEDK
ncbi:MAG: hypothetical protein O3A15_03170 [Proteobacteria bacterium]|nr:hypothetical protein [Pseudomonadota bacterium]